MLFNLRIIKNNPSDPYYTTKRPASLTHLWNLVVFWIGFRWRGARLGCAADAAALEATQESRSGFHNHAGRDILNRNRNQTCKAWTRSPRHDIWVNWRFIWSLKKILWGSLLTDSLERVRDKAPWGLIISYWWIGLFFGSSGGVARIQIIWMVMSNILLILIYKPLL